MIILRSLLVIYFAIFVPALPIAQGTSLINVPLKSELSDFNRETYRLSIVYLISVFCPVYREGRYRLLASRWYPIYWRYIRNRKTAKSH